MEKETMVLSARLEKTLVLKIKKNAEKENRTVSNYLDTILRKVIK